MATYLAIIGSNDTPLYELLLNPNTAELHLLQFIAYAALDHLTLAPQLYHRHLDRLNDIYVSAYVTFAGRLLLSRPRH